MARAMATPASPVPPDRLHADAVRVLSGWAAPDDGQERLRRAYLDHLAAHPDAMWRSCSPDHLTASALVLDADGERVLLTLHHRHRRWLQMGGHCEPGDATLEDASRREATEESGIAGLRLDPDPLRLDRHQVARGPRRAAHHLDVQYLAWAPPAARARISAESAALEWFDTGALPDDTDDSVRALVAAAVRRQASSVQGSPAASDTPSR